MFKKLTLWALRRLIRNQYYNNGGVELLIPLLIEEYRRRFPEDNDMTTLLYLTEYLQDELGFD